jgi:hypothetical protein
MSAHRLLSCVEFARRVGRDERTVRRWAAAGTAGCVRLGKRVRGWHWPTWVKSVKGATS